MNNIIKEKLAKVYELVKRGEQGEKQAAEQALQRLLKKYNLSEDEIAKIHLKKYAFKYASELDKQLLFQLFNYFFENKYCKFYQNTNTVKEINVEMEYLDWVQIETAYEYFKRHLNAQWRKLALPLIKRCKTTKGKNKRREELQEAFFTKYIIKSGIYRPNQIEKKKVSNKEFENLCLFSNVEGGVLKGQMTTGLYLE